MKSLFLAVALCAIGSGEVLAQEPAKAPAAAVPGAEARQFSADAAMSSEAKAAIAARPAKVCRPGAIAAAAMGSWAGSDGSDSPLVFDTPTTNEGGGWDNSPSFSSFTAPCSGLYYLAAGFTRDAYAHADHRCGGQGTRDDVSLYMTSNGKPLPMREAWAGEGDGDRATASTDTLVRLRRGDVLMFWVHSDGGQHRCLARYNFTGFKVAD